MAGFLASDDAWNINGQIFYVNGGRVGLTNHPVPEDGVFKAGLWSMAELDDAVHNVLLKNRTNPGPPREDVEVAGRDTPRSRWPSASREGERQMAAPLEGRTILVTGSGRGIGSEVAKLAGSLGANVIVNDPGVNVDGTGHDDGPAATIAKEITDAGGVAAANFDTVATEAGGENMIKQAWMPTAGSTASSTSPGSSVTG